jgi:hypothetical protein
MVDGWEAIEVTFGGTGNLKSFTVQYPLEFARYLAPALMNVIDGSALSGEINTNW